jgi:hypothetical protein
MALDNHPGKRCTGQNFQLFYIRKGGSDNKETEVRTVCEHFPMVWDDLSVFEQLFLQDPARGLENVEVDYRWRLLLLDSENIWGGVLKGTEGDK